VRERKVHRADAPEPATWSAAAEPS